MSDTKNSKNEVAPAKTKKLSKPKKSEQKTKKAPSLFLKKYTAAKLEKKIYKKIHIPDDKHFVKSFIKDLISAENPRKPLSDSKLSELLLEKGMNVARRTVAKYREALGIESSSQRKKLI